MQLVLQRDPFRVGATTGTLSVNSAPFCVTLEPSATATFPRIPAGKYQVEIAFSPRFKRPMPHVMNVSGRAGILIHWGNYAENTEGCVLVGETRGVLNDGAPAIWNSREAFDKLYQELQDAQAEGITIDVQDAEEGVEGVPEAT